MPAKKHPLGTGAKNGVIKRPNTSYTSPRAIRLAQRRAECLDYRLQGHSYRVIGETMHISPACAHEYVCRCLKEMVPLEDAKKVLSLELARLDQLEAAVFQNASEGDIPSIDACLRIQNQRARLCGLYPNEKNGLHVNIGGDPSAPSAESEGISVVFVKSSHWLRDVTDKTVNGKAAFPGYGGSKG
jgi:hypothetical protein